MTGNMTTAKPPAISRKSTEVRQAEVVAALLDLLHEVGPEGITTTTIARRVGLSQGALFRHFPRKIDIWKAAVAVIGDKVEPQLALAANRPGPIIDRIREIQRTYLEIVEEAPAITALLFYREPPGLEGQLRKAIAEHCDGGRNLIRSLLAQGQDKREIDPELDIDRAATLFAGVSHALLFRQHLEGAHRPLDEFDDLFTMLEAIVAKPGAKRTVLQSKGSEIK
jgi:AcrR family transcriptional regulator